MNNLVTTLPRVVFGGGRESWARQRLTRLLDRLAVGRLHLHFDGAGDHLLEGRDSDGPAADLQVHDTWRLWRMAVLGGDLGFAEAYLEGAWSSRDLPGLLYLLSMNLDSLGSGGRRSLAVKWLGRLRHALSDNSRAGSRRNIAAHYDLGNDFYARWLDDSMSYSSAVFDQGGDFLQAQQRKYQLMLELLKPRPAEHVLEIGCGWGAFAEAAARRDLKVTAVTLSKEQFTYASRRMRDAGLLDRVQLRLQDYRDVPGQYDHIVSIEMFEAVGMRHWPTYFRRLHELLLPGGRAALQVIVIREDLFGEYAREAGGFIQRYIFPGGMLPTESHLTDLALQNGLRLTALARFGEDYADTLAEWRVRFEQQTAWLEANGFDQRFRRMWLYYLAFCEAGFRDGRLDLVQLGLQK